MAHSAQGPCVTLCVSNDSFMMCETDKNTHTDQNMFCLRVLPNIVSGISLDPYLTVLCTLPAPSSDTISKYLLQESVSSFCVEHSGPIQRHY